MLKNFVQVAHSPSQCIKTKGTAFFVYGMHSGTALYSIIESEIMILYLRRSSAAGYPM